MKKTVIALCALSLAGVVAAQTAPVKPAVKRPAAAKKVSVKKHIVKKPVATKAKATRKAAAKSSRLVAAPVTGAAAAGAAVAAQASPKAALPAIAQQVYLGTMQCELGNRVTVAQDGADKDVYRVSSGHNNYQMRQVATTSGVVRLEDKSLGATWLQLGNKSMLMDQKRGERVADGCQNTQQVARDQELKRNPVNLLQ